MAGTKSQTILVVEDEQSIASFVSLYLKNAGYEVKAVATGSDALIQAASGNLSLIILDLMLPDLDGIEVCRRLRKTSDVPILMLTARDEDVDKIIGLEVGADDYMTKPFNPDELEARISAVLRRTDGAVAVGAGPVLKYPGVEIDLERRRVTVDGEEIRLSRTEWELLAQLAGNAGRVMMHAELLSRIWGPEYRDEAHYLRTWVSRLRAKLEPGEDSPALITTYPGMGYRFEAPPAE